MDHISIVDVPGHERFIRTMLAGTTGIDSVLFVVAADDGIMPQTLEHLDILRLLGIESAVIAISKIDRVSAERVVEVSNDMGALIKGTPFADAPLIPVSYSWRRRGCRGEGGARSCLPKSQGARQGPFLQAACRQELCRQGIWHGSYRHRRLGRGLYQ